MNHVRVTTITGAEVEITHEEAQRIAEETMLHPSHHNVDEFHRKVEERNNHYHRKAVENIRVLAARYGFSELQNIEPEYKRLLSAVLLADVDVGDLIVEIIEERISKHHQEIYSV